MKGFVERGGVWVAGQFVIFLLIVLLALKYPGNGPVAWRWVGAVVLILAGIIAIAGAAALGRNLTPFPKPSANSELVQHGIFAMIRHPLYTAVILAGLGWSALWLSWPAFLAAALLLPFLHAKSCREETFLRQKFAGYREYEARTHRFIPLIY